MAASSELLDEIAWKALFEERKIMDDIDKNGIHVIPAKVISAKREARLMTKFDHLSKRPDIFKKEELSILANSRSSYVLGRFDCYMKMPKPSYSGIIERHFPEWIQSISAANLYSEASALLCAQHTGLIADVLEEDEENVALTVFNRMSTGKFDFRIRRAISLKGPKDSWPLSVDKAQCEIDGGFEGVESFAIIEVKNQEVDDFHIRQLYYPYCLWANKLTKPVVPIFLTYSNEIFSFYIYEFTDLNDYNSMRLVREKRYQIVPTEIGVSDIHRLLTETRSEPEPIDIPFPQADRFERVVDLLSRIATANGSLTQDDVTNSYAFDLRQTQYYATAGQYLNLIRRFQDEDKGVRYELTPLGIQIMNKAPRARNLALIAAILSRSVFRGSVQYYLDNSTAPATDVIVKLIQQAGLNLTGTTPARRAQTVKGWIRWVVSLTAEG